MTAFVVFAATDCHGRRDLNRGRATLLVTSPLRKNVLLTDAFVGQIRARQHIEVRALDKGYLTGTFVDEGQRVAKGTKMFQIMPAIYQAEVKKALAEAERLEIEYRNTKLLADNDVVSPNELALSKAKWDKAKAELSLATTRESLTTLRAPFDGIVGRFQVRLGSLLDEGDLLTTLADNSVVWVYFNLSETQYLAYQSKQHSGAQKTVRLMMANGEPFPHAGVIQTIEADFDNATGNVALRAAFPNEGGLLRHGQTGKVLMSEPLDGALLIPQKATFEVLAKKYVFVVDDANVVHARAITIAHELPQVFAVATGLAENDRIVLEGLRRVKDGDAIDVDYREPAKVLAGLEVPAG